MICRTLFTIVLVLAATSAQAQTKDRLDRRDKLFGFEAVGLLEGQGGTCTAALIARDVALTAAHCVHRKRGKFVFRAAFSDGAALASRQVTDIVIAQAYIEADANRDRAGEVANDVALVRLSSPIYDAGINPYEIAKSPLTGASLTLASYGRGRMGALQLERGCRLTKRYRGGVVRVDCDATYGSSGAPVFTQGSGRPRIFSIVSSGVTVGESNEQTLGVELTEIVPELMRELANKRSLAPSTPNARRIKIGERATGGARFVRPGGS
ncbi:MAG: trypsin-like peptidase domain-containing protein [Pseudomonadota bacterium]